MANKAVKEVLDQMPFADICITSDRTLSTEAAPSDAFTLDDIEGVAVSFVKAEGEKCGRCWKILPDVVHTTMRVSADVVTTHFPKISMCVKNLGAKLAPNFTSQLPPS